MPWLGRNLSKLSDEPQDSKEPGRGCDSGSLPLPLTPGISWSEVARIQKPLARGTPRLRSGQRENESVDDAVHLQK
jgi:hypothetical protein